MKIKLIACSLILFFLIAVSCIPSGDKGQMYGVGIRFSSSAEPPKEESDPGTKYNYRLKPGSSFSGYYQVENVRPQKNNYLILTFLDYQQEPFSLDDKKALSHKVELDAYEDKWWSFKTGKIKEGFHDYAMVVIWNPDNNSLEEEFRLETKVSYFSANRANILAGKDKPPDIQFSGPIKKVKQPQYDNLAHASLSKTESPDDWIKEEVKPGQEINFTIHVGNIEETVKDFAIILLLDYKQIPIKINEDSVLYGRIRPDEVQMFEASLKAPMKPGIYELMAIKAISPFQKLSETNKYEDRMDSSMRTAIIVK